MREVEIVGEGSYGWRKDKKGREERAGEDGYQ